MSKALSKLPRPPCDLTKYDNASFEKNPLLKFRVSNLRRKHHFELLRRKARDERTKVLRKPLSKPQDIPVATDPQSLLLQLHECALEMPVPKMKEEIFEKIKRSVPQRLRSKYPDLVKQYMAEVCTEHDKVLRSYSVNRILQSPNRSQHTNQEPTKIDFSFKHLGRTENYHVFQENCKKLKKELYLVHPFVRVVLHYSALDFPEILNNYGNYNNKDRQKVPLTLAQFSQIAEKDLQSNVRFIKHSWYPKIIATINKYYKRKALNIPQWNRAFRCIKGLINRQINNIKVNTLEHLLDVILDKSRIPLLKMNIVCYNGISLEPTFYSVVKCYTDILRDISKVATNLDAIELQVDRMAFPTAFDKLPVSINDTYFEEAVERLTHALETAYASILEYIDEFHNKYRELFDEHAKTELEAFLSKPHEFQEYFERIEFFRNYLSLLRSEMQREYFDIAIIDKSMAICELRRITNSLIKMITNRIVAEHMNDQKAICKAFEEIKEKAVAIPRSTEELLASGEYMAKVKTKLIAQLHDRIQSSLKFGADLFGLTELSQEHIQLQCTTINWLGDIKFVFEKNTALQETYKVQFEEHLQSVAKKLNDDVDQMVPSVNIINDMSDTEKFRDYFILLENFIEQLKIFDDYVTWINKEEKLFKFPRSQYPTLDALKDFVSPFADLMRLCIQWLRYYYVWMDGPFEYLKPSFVQKTTDEFYKEFIKTQKYYMNRIKLDLMGNPVCKFRGQTEDPDPEKHPVPLRLCGKMIKWINDFRTGVFIVNVMCNPALRTRHWNEMSEIVGFDITPNAGTTLRKIMDLDIYDKLNSLEVVSIGANKELQLQGNLYAMTAEWSDVEFKTEVHKEANVRILSSLDDIQTLLDDHIIKTLSMRGSAFVKPSEKQVRQWYDKLLRINRTFDEWQRVQYTYLYLHPIFSSKNIIAEMHQENLLYLKVAGIFHRYIETIGENPSVMDIAPADGFLEDTIEANQLLDMVMDGVNKYLEKKRMCLPRFFFLSNDEMLAILSETKNPLNVQTNLKKCFEGIAYLDFDGHLNATAMNSEYHEKVKFKTKVSTQAAGGNVEKWLIKVEQEMLSAVKREITKAITSYSNKPVLERLQELPQMAFLCVAQVSYVAKVHAMISAHDLQALAAYKNHLEQKLKGMVEITKLKDILHSRKITLTSVIIASIHAVNVLESLISHNVQCEDDFHWLAQLRCYWQDNNVQVRVLNASIGYAYEYLGNYDRLIITPLTDRCYRTLISAYQLHLNGAPEGPAGTGKTETVKDLAKALAILCKIFNCSESMDFVSLGKLFKGLVSCGAWVCFDEFNRINLEVLSVVAQQIHSILHAVRAKRDSICFEGADIKVNPLCFICITLNPGYAGRSELPDNLKVLFRPISMITPDYAMIAETALFAYGFASSKNLSSKIVTAYRLCADRLSLQNHYDYGMRAVKTVLSYCEQLKKRLPDENENALVIKALRDVNVPKFLSNDIPLFEGILSDLFPQSQLPMFDYEPINTSFKEVCKNMKLQPKENFRCKVIQAFETMKMRQGFMLVGNPMTGKSTTLMVLARVVEHLQQGSGAKVHMAVVNPKAITLDQLYGEFDRATYQWKDGVVPIIFRKFATDTSADLKWLIFDGPIDVIWIENMNTVLDDNKKLCLTSGEIISMTPEMSIIFETLNLAQASPATVSRCGMVYFEPKTLGWETFAESWLRKCDPRWSIEGSNSVMTLLQWIIPPTTDFIRKSCHQYLLSGEFNIIRSTLDIFQMLLQDAIEDNLDEYSRYLSAWFQAALIYSVSWGIGGILDSESRYEFDLFFRSLWSGTCPDCPIPTNVTRIEVSMPSEGLVIDYMYLFKQKGSWKYWPDLVKRIEPEESALGMQVATIDTGRYMHLLEMHVKYRKKVLLVGPTGTGKSFYMKHMLMNKLSTEHYSPAFMSLTVKISAKQTQETLHSKLIKRRKGNYGPQKDKFAIIFIDDMNMPEKDLYGAQPPLELLRQFFDYGYIYDLQDRRKATIDELLMFSACGIPGGSRQHVSPRFLSHFNIFSINNFAEETVNKIFTTSLFLSFKKGGHGNDVLSSVNQIVSGTQEIYRNVCEGLKPTPTKSHYMFNIRDIARVCTGCSLLRKESVDNKRIFVRLWYHECLRVFQDRVVNDVDQYWIFTKMNKVIREHFNEELESVFENYCDEGSQLTLYRVNQLMFGSYSDDNTNGEERKYEEVPSIETFRKIAYKKLEEYNAKRKHKMNIVLFLYALQHLNKICRIISIQGESGLLVGIAGTGRQSLTKLAATICRVSLYQPKITKTYGLNDWHVDVKEALKEAGGEGMDVVFLISEQQIKMERFLQDIDCILNQGEVPNLYAVDEKQEILEMVRLSAQGGNRNADITPLEVFSFFVNRCKQKLHIILCFSPIGSVLRTRIRLYPSLVNCCTIDWFQLWPEEALHVVAEHYIDETNLDATVKQSLVAACRHIHITVTPVIDEFCNETGRFVYSTPTSFLELLNLFRILVEKKQKEIMHMKRRYIAGLETLQKATVAVAAMQKELSALQPKLLKMAENSRSMMVEINRETGAAEAAAEQVKKDELVANAQATAAQTLKDECEKDLAQAIPVLEDAIQALNTLKPADITLVKSMKNPPSAIKLVMAAVCVIKGVSPDRINDPSTGKKTNDYWGPSKRILGDMGFLQSLKDFDKDNINPDIMKRIRKDFIPHKDFQPHIVLKASSAAEGLCKWIIAMDLYDAVAKIVAPKKTRLQVAEKEYGDTMKILNEKREMAEALEKKVMQLNEELERANAEMQKTSDEVEFCKKRLLRAENLISSLGGEKSRWSSAAENLQTQLDNIPGDMLISSGVIAYLSALSAPFRNKCIENWYNKCSTLKIPRTDDFKFTSVLGSDIQIQAWNIDELPSDTFSIENAVIMANSNKCNLFIDPQSQANKWIKNMERLNQLQVVKLTQSNYMKTIETAITIGRPVLVENVMEDLDVSLEPILTGQTFQQNGCEYLCLHNNVVKMSRKFKLYLTTSLRNPQFLPEVYNKVTIINFALTQQGLEDQLLGIVVAKEHPELQELRQTLITEKAKNRAMLKNTEDKILETLSSSKVDILENEAAIRILDESKILVAGIKAKQAASEETETKIENFRQNYAPVSIHSAVLYYTTTDLPNIDIMYQFSLNWYTALYIRSIENANKSKDLLRRRKYLMDAITLNLYNTVCRSIFERHRLLFSFILTTSIMISTGQLTRNQLQFLLSKDGRAVLDKPLPKHDGQWITEKVWRDINLLENVPELNGFVNSFLSNLSLWKAYFESAEPHDLCLPPPWEEKTSRFEKVVILQSLRPEKLYLAVAKFIEFEMGSQYINPPQFDLLKSYEDSNCLSPLIFILSPGIDPMASLFLFAKKMGFNETFESISLGQGQEAIAEKLIANAQFQGSWICLQNCHLAESFMPRLQQIWENMDLYNTASTFRLWLTSYPCSTFPDILLQNGVKVTDELPTGLRENLLRTYHSEPMSNEKFYTGCPQKDRAFTRLLYGICFFHAIVQERQKFGSLGWNIPYGFNDTDFQTSAHQLLMFLNDYSDIPYSALQYLIAECNYGGRISEKSDRLVVTTILESFINDEVVNDLHYRFGDEDNYILPRKSEHREMIRYINDNVPTRPHPGVYGLHSNAGIKRELETSLELVNFMILTTSVLQEAQALDNDKIVMQKMNDILASIPNDLDLETAKKIHSIDNGDVMNVVLLQEMESYQFLLELIRNTCNDLINAIDGTTPMTPELECMMSKVNLDRIPKAWTKCSYETTKPLALFIQDFNERIKWITSWNQHGMPSSIWISGLFLPRGFFAGIIQSYSRNRGISIDEITIDNQVLSLELDSYDSQPYEGIKVHGFTIEGARWDPIEKCLAEQVPRVLFETMPTILFKPVIQSHFIEDLKYKCPAYKTSDRRGTINSSEHSTNFIIDVFLETKHPNKHWVKRSVALISQANP